MWFWKNSAEDGRKNVNGKVIRMGIGCFEMNPAGLKTEVQGYWALLPFLLGPHGGPGRSKVNPECFRLLDFPRPL